MKTSSILKTSALGILATLVTTASASEGVISGGGLSERREIFCDFSADRTLELSFVSAPTRNNGYSVSAEASIQEMYQNGNRTRDLPNILVTRQDFAKPGFPARRGGILQYANQDRSILVTVDTTVRVAAPYLTPPLLRNKTFYNARLTSQVHPFVMDRAGACQFD